VPLATILSFVALGTGLRSGMASAAGHRASAADLYYRAYRNLDQTSRFDTVMQTTFSVNRKRTYTFRLRYVAPHRVLQSSDFGGRLGTSRQVQVDNTYCSWTVGRNFRRIFCRHLSWDRSAASAEVKHHPAEIHLVRAHFSLDRMTGAAYRIKVTGRAGLGCPPGWFCPPSSGALVGVLSVDLNGLRPLSFSAVVDSRIRNERVSIVYRYGHRFMVTLPHGSRVPCPPHAQPHGWCLSQR
jgi:hypothetical protein